jgi:hypothetical protein
MFLRRYQKKYIIIKIKGGLGNQLFCYAYGYSLAKKYSATLYVDKYSGFLNDWKYQRNYLLDNFKLSWGNLNFLFIIFLKVIFVLKARFNFWSFIKKISEKELSFNADNLCLQDGLIFYLDGYWQSEKYFIDLRNDILNQFSFKKLLFDNNILKLINSKTSVALHIRIFDFNNINSENNLDLFYYQEATKFVLNILPSAHFFIFSNDISSNLSYFIDKLKLDNYTIVKSSDTDDTLRDFYLMQKCNYHIIANSTFSWWAAWLSQSDNKIIVASSKINNDISAWGFDGLIPDNWKLI